MELERQRSRGKDELEMLGVENEELHSKIEEYKQDLVSGLNICWVQQKIHY